MISIYHHDNLNVDIAILEYPLGGSSKKGSHVYFLLITAMVIPLWHPNVLLWHQVTMIASEQHLYQTIVQFDKTIVLPRKTCNRKYTWLPFLLLPPSGYSIWGTENYKWSKLYIIPNFYLHQDDHLTFIACSLNNIVTYPIVGDFVKENGHMSMISCTWFTYC